MFDKIIDFIKKIFIRDMLVTVNYNQPKQIDSKNNMCYIYEISENTEIELLDDLLAIDSPVIFDVYWQNTNDTSELTFVHDTDSIVLAGDAVDLTLQNHITFIRHPGSSGGKSILAIIEAVNSAVLIKR